MSAPLRSAIVVLLLSVLSLWVVAWRGATDAARAPGPTASSPPISQEPPPIGYHPRPIDRGTQRTGEALPCVTPGPATPTPFNGATESSTDRESPGPESPADPSLRDAGGDVLDGDGCVVPDGPPPVIPEAPLPILLPLTAGVALVGALLLVRQRNGGRQRSTGKEAADGE